MGTWWSKNDFKEIEKSITEEINPSKHLFYDTDQDIHGWYLVYWLKIFNQRMWSIQTEDMSEKFINKVRNESYLKYVEFQKYNSNELQLDYGTYVNEKKYADYHSSNVGLSNFYLQSSTIEYQKLVKTYTERHAVPSNRSMDYIKLLLHNQAMTHFNPSRMFPSKIDTNTAMKYVETRLKVRFEPQDSWLDKIYGVQLYKIYDKTSPQTGYVYIKKYDNCEVDVMDGITPLIPPFYGPGTNLIICHSNPMFVRYLTTAVHYSFVPFYNIPNEVRHIPSINVETYYRAQFKYRWSDIYKRAQIALALADLESKDTEHFNQLYKKYSKFSDPGNICSHFQPYLNPNRIYYGNVLGMFLNPKPDSVAKWIRDPNLTMEKIIDDEA